MPSFTSAEDFGAAEMIFTYGESGLPRDNLFCVGEKLFATIRVSGLKHTQFYSGQLAVAAAVLDADGREVLKVENQPQEYLQVLGGDVLETSLVVNSDRKGIPPGNYSLEVLLRQSPTGRTCRIRRDFVWKDPQAFVTGEFDWYLDDEKDYPAGPKLQVGRPYTLARRIANFSFAERRFEIAAQTSLLERNGVEVIGRGPWSSVDAQVPQGVGLPERAWDEILVSFSRSGRFFVNEESIDSVSGARATARLPVVVGGADVRPHVDGRDAAPFLVLTHGKHGAVRQSDYLIGEDIWMTLGFVDAARGGRTRQKLHIFFLDAKGESVTDFSLGESEVESGFEEPFFIGQMQFGVEPERGVPVEPIRKIQVRLTEKATGNETVVSAPIRFVPVKGLATMDLRLSADRHDSVPAGKFLIAGRTYYMQGRLANFSIQDYGIDVTHQVRPFTEAGEPVAGMELVLDHQRQLTVAEKLNGQVSVTLEFTPNRPGKFLLRSTFTDNRSGETFSTDLPIEVVSPFEFINEKP